MKTRLSSLPPCPSSRGLLVHFLVPPKKRFSSGGLPFHAVKRPRLSVEGISILEPLSLFLGAFLIRSPQILMFYFFPSGAKMSFSFDIPLPSAGTSYECRPYKRYDIPSRSCENPRLHFLPFSKSRRACYGSRNVNPTTLPGAI